ncbi:MAG: hypothetical protein DYG99_14720 [Bacteroidetes bacterium CHB5]|nr:hypothetical protein [Bacteroidetes bacterium CHB5]
MFFLTGGPMGGGGAGMLARLGARQLLTRGATKLLTRNVAKELAKNTAFEFGSQMLASGGDLKKSLANMDMFDIATSARFSGNKGLALLAGVVDLDFYSGFTFVLGPGRYNKSLESSLSDGLIQMSIGSMSNTKPLLQESILEVLGGTVSQKISDTW